MALLTRMMLQGQLSVRGFDLIGSRITLNPQGLIEIGLEGSLIRDIGDVIFVWHNER